MICLAERVGILSRMFVLQCICCMPKLLFVPHSLNFNRLDLSVGPVKQMSFPSGAQTSYSYV